MPSVTNLKKLKTKPEFNKTNEQQQMQETNNKKPRTTTTTSVDKTTTNTASRVATIADMFKRKQQEHEKKQLQQTTRKPPINIETRKPNDVAETKTTTNKTWSSVSNSSLSKTFALASLESLKFGSFVFSLQTSFSLKLILVQKKIWV